MTYEEQLERQWGLNTIWLARIAYHAVMFENDNPFDPMGEDSLADDE